MEITFDRELEEKVNRAAAENRSPAGEYVTQLVAHYVDHDSWFRQKVRGSLERLDRGEFLDDQEMELRIKGMFES